MSQPHIIIDDGRYYIDLNCNYEAPDAPGFLALRCPRGLTTPGGFDCLGSFDKKPDGTWQASIHTLLDEETDSDARTVAAGVSRMDAIAALWKHRESAFSRHA